MAVASGRDDTRRAVVPSGIRGCKRLTFDDTADDTASTVDSRRLADFMHGAASGNRTPDLRITSASVRCSGRSAVVRNPCAARGFRQARTRAHVPELAPLATEVAPREDRCRASAPVVAPWRPSPTLIPGSPASTYRLPSAAQSSTAGQPRQGRLRRRTRWRTRHPAGRPSRMAATKGRGEVSARPTRRAHQRPDRGSEWTMSDLIRQVNGWRSGVFPKDSPASLRCMPRSPNTWPSLDRINPIRRWPR
jgi:hypothetical protein